jgi:hypothetical protein
MLLYAFLCCAYTFSLCRESSNMILRYKLLISEVVLSQPSSCSRASDGHRQANNKAAFIPSLLLWLWRILCLKARLGRCSCSGDGVTTHYPIGRRVPLTESLTSARLHHRQHCVVPDFRAPPALTIILRIGSQHMVMSVTAHNTKLKHILVVPEAMLNIMNLLTFETLRIPISGLCLMPRSAGSARTSWSPTIASHSLSSLVR